MEASRNGSKGQGWAAFAATMVLVVGVFNLIYGLAALIEDDYFFADELSSAPLPVGLGPPDHRRAAGDHGDADLRRERLRRRPGIMFAGFNAIAALLAIGAYPVWSVIILVVDGLIIYALTVYGDALKPSPIAC